MTNISAILECIQVGIELVILSIFVYCWFKNPLKENENPKPRILAFVTLVIQICGNVFEAVASFHDSGFRHFIPKANDYEYDLNGKYQLDTKLSELTLFFYCMLHIAWISLIAYRLQTSFDNTSYQLSAKHIRWLSFGILSLCITALIPIAALSLLLLNIDTNEYLVLNSYPYPLFAGYIAHMVNLCIATVLLLTMAKMFSTRLYGLTLTIHEEIDHIVNVNVDIDQFLTLSAREKQLLSLVGKQTHLTFVQAICYCIFVIVDLIAGWSNLNSVLQIIATTLVMIASMADFTAMSLTFAFTHNIYNKFCHRCHKKILKWYQFRADGMLIDQYNFYKAMQVRHEKRQSNITVGSSFIRTKTTVELAVIEHK